MCVLDAAGVVRDMSVHGGVLESTVSSNKSQLDASQNGVKIEMRKVESPLRSVFELVHGLPISYQDDTNGR